MGEMRNAYRILVEKPAERRSLGRRRRRYDDNIRMDLGGAGWEVVDWTHLPQERDHCWALLNTAMKLRA
jgi:hypothetical protein